LISQVKYSNKAYIYIKCGSSKRSISFSTPPSGHIGKRRHIVFNLSVRSCEHDILKTDQTILMPIIGTSSRAVAYNDQPWGSAGQLCVKVTQRQRYLKAWRRIILDPSVE